MSQQRPPIEDAAAEAFALQVGKTMQNYGTIEYLLNEALELLIPDGVVAGHLIKQGVAKRLDVVASLLDRKAHLLAARSLDASRLVLMARAAFRERNKVAHNPCVVRRKVQDGVPLVLVGIHVIRHTDNGKSEEWIELQKLKELALQAREVLDAFVSLHELLLSEERGC